MIKISLITVTYNAGQFISDCVASVISQTHLHVEYIIIDGKSTDDTLNRLDRFQKNIQVLVSEKDRGIYDAMNKGIALATGDVIGILNADDFFAASDVLAQIAETFENTGAYIVHGNLVYVNRFDTNTVIREWGSKPYQDNMFQWGWMPAHPTFYARRELFQRYGDYNLFLKSAADYELMLRFIHKHQIHTHYLNKVFVKMRVGGVSNQSISNRITASLNDLKAMRSNGIKFPLLAVMMKPIRKITQFIRPFYTRLLQ